MIPDSIAAHHILRAIRAIDRDGIPPHRRSTGYDLIVGRKRYPPKLVISLAHRAAEGSEWPAEEFHGGREANNFLAALGFNIVDKRGRRVRVQPVNEDEAAAFLEGRALYRKHRRAERDSRLTRLVKARRLVTDSHLKCEACGFSFRKRYGPRGTGFIEAHHTRTVSSLRRRVRVMPSEIALVCSNCHRMLHKSRPWLSIRDLRKIIRATTGRTG